MATPSFLHLDPLGRGVLPLLLCPHLCTWRPPDTWRLLGWSVSRDVRESIWRPLCTWRSLGRGVAHGATLPLWPTMLLVIKNFFGELMMFLVIEDSRVLENFSRWWKYSLSFSKLKMYLKQVFKTQILTWFMFDTYFWKYVFKRRNFKMLFGQYIKFWGKVYFLNVIELDNTWCRSHNLLVCLQDCHWI